jgi:hypothetical protein
VDAPIVLGGKVFGWTAAWSHLADSQRSQHNRLSPAYWLFGRKVLTDEASQ